MTQKILCISEYYHFSIEDIFQMQGKEAKQNFKKIFTLETDTNIKKDECKYMWMSQQDAIQVGDYGN